MYTLHYTPSGLGLVGALPAIQQAMGLRDTLVSFTTLGLSSVAFFIASAAGPMLGHGTGSGFAPTAIVVAALAVLALYMVALKPWAARRMAKRLDLLSPPAPTSLELDNSGLRISDADTQMAFSWRRVRGVVDVPDGIAIMAGYTGLHVPAAAFGSEREKSDVIAFIRDRANPPRTRSAR